jgi:hypothetical protein
MSVVAELIVFVGEKVDAVAKWVRFFAEEVR